MGRKLVDVIDDRVRYAIRMKWDELKGEVLISGHGVDTSEIIMVNEVEYDVEFDSSGSATLEIPKSDPPRLWLVRCKTPGEKIDQRLGFFY